MKRELSNLNDDFEIVDKELKLCFDCDIDDLEFDDHYNIFRFKIYNINKINIDGAKVTSYIDIPDKKTNLKNSTYNSLILSNKGL